MEKNTNKPRALMIIGAFNALHGFFHILQAVQSFLLAVESSRGHHHHGGDWFSDLMHNPILAVFWCLIGLWTVKIGWKDYRHHKRCKRKSKKN